MTSLNNELLFVSIKKNIHADELIFFFVAFCEYNGKYNEKFQLATIFISMNIYLIF